MADDLLHLIRMTDEEQEEVDDVLRETRDILLTQANRLSPKSRWRDVVLDWASRLDTADRLADARRPRRLGVVEGRKD